VTQAERRVYVDANIFIFALEGEPRFGPAASALLQSVDDGRVAAVTSELTLAEVLVKPLEHGRAALAEQFMTVVSRSRLELHPVSRAILIRSAEIRAAYGGRLADTVHLATAMETSCSAVVSEDMRMRVPPALLRLSAADFLASNGLQP
jgi:predicted nucleic acid-binding protein